MSELSISFHDCSALAQYAIDAFIAGPGTPLTLGLFDLKELVAFVEVYHQPER